MLRQQLQRSIDGKTEVLGQLLNLLVAESRPDLVGGDRQVRAIAKPRLHLVVEPALLELGNKPLQVAEIGFRQNGRNQGGRLSGYDLPDDTLECATDVVEKSHHTSPTT